MYKTEMNKNKLYVIESIYGDHFTFICIRKRV